MRAAYTPKTHGEAHAMKTEHLTQLGIIGKVLLAVAALGLAAACAPQSWDVASADPITTRGQDNDGGGGSGGGGGY